MGWGQTARIVAALSTANGTTSCSTAVPSASLFLVDEVEQDDACHVGKGTKLHGQLAGVAEVSDNSGPRPPPEPPPREDTYSHSYLFSRNETTRQMQVPKVAIARIVIDRSVPTASSMTPPWKRVASGGGGLSNERDVARDVAMTCSPMAKRLRQSIDSNMDWPCRGDEVELLRQVAGCKADLGFVKTFLLQRKLFSHSTEFQRLGVNSVLDLAFLHEADFQDMGMTVVEIQTIQAGMSGLNVLSLEALRGQDEVVDLTDSQPSNPRQQDDVAERRKTFTTNLEAGIR